MRQSTRIIINTMATYGQSLFSMVAALFSARWVLMALGDVDFGLYGVVGGLISIIIFFNTAMTVGVARFYAYAIGREEREGADGSDELKRWFNTAVSIHAVLPLISLFVGFPVGLYAIENWLTVPPDRIDAALWVFKMSMVTGAVNVFTVPFSAMFAARQHLFELAFFDIAKSILFFVGAFILLRVNDDRLIFYASYMTVISAGIPLLVSIRAVIKYNACRVRLSYLFNRSYLRELFGFIGWKIFGISCLVGRTQGSPVLINLFFGPQVNAAYSIANRVSIQATTISTAMMRAFQPAITSMEGRGERERVLTTSLQVCKFGTLLVLIFVIPLMLEMEFVLRLWLVQAPEHAGVLCQWLLAMLVVDRVTAGHMLAVNAKGKIALYELVQGSLLLLALPVGWFLFSRGMGPVGIGYALFGSMTAYCIGRLVFAKKLLGLPIGIWVRQVGLPMAGIIVSASAIAWFTIRFFEEGVLRVLISGSASALVILIFGWFVVLKPRERCLFKDLFWSLIRRFTRKGSRTG
jgi:O-antigen/teichoic acid export membrane protein